MTKIPITILVTEDQYKRINEKKRRTGNSQGSIIREAIERYLGGAIMNFLEYKDARDFLNATGLSIEAALKIVETELERLKQEPETDA